MAGHDAPLDTIVVVRGSGLGFAQEIATRSHRLSADKPLPNGGTDTGPTPDDLLLAALGSCASMTVALTSVAPRARERLEYLNHVAAIQRRIHFRARPASCDLAGPHCSVGFLNLDRGEEARRDFLSRLAASYLNERRDRIIDR